jgi:uncharacterized membrane protein SpoIIM required for sporulation
LSEPPPPTGEVPPPVMGEPAAPARRSDPFWPLVEIAATRLQWVALVFVVELVAVSIVSTTPFFPGEAETYRQQAQALSSAMANVTAPQEVVDIFSNNFRVSMIDLIPGAGVAIFATSIYVTARVAEGIATIQGIPSAYAVATLLVLPSTWMELPAYSLAGVENVFFVYAAYVAAKGTRERLEKEVSTLIATVGLIGVVLIFAAVFEVGEIEFKDYALLFWVPFAGVAWVTLRLYRKAKRDWVTFGGAGPSGKGGSGPGGGSGTPWLGPREVAPEDDPDEHHQGAGEPGYHGAGEVGGESEVHDQVQDGRPHDPGDEAQRVPEQPESEEH